MPKKKPTVTVGIPAYNEEQNIRQLLEALLGQRRDSFVLQEIIVVSDASTDGTVDCVRSFDHPLVRVVAGKNRQGQQARQNQIVALHQSDVLLLVEADTLPAHDQVIEELVLPILRDARGIIGMTMSERMATPPQGFLEKILWHGGELKNGMFRDWKDGNNIYTAAGHAIRALPRAVTDQLKWPADVPEDSYAYLFITGLALEVRKQDDARSCMRHVATMQERFRQCTKYVTGKRALRNYFATDRLAAEYHLPLALIVRHTWRAMLTRPAWTVLILLELIVNRLFTWRRRGFTFLYEPFRSSKDLSQVALQSYVN